MQLLVYRNHPLIEDSMRKDFVVSAAMTEDQACASATDAGFHRRMPGDDAAGGVDDQGIEVEALMLLPIRRIVCYARCA
jgi:hypothetical protein